jgi:UDP-N-acetylmuramoyl-L-alanyl-D-glutamate--2,6-diaminopimelate ligase
VRLSEVVPQAPAGRDPEVTGLGFDHREVGAGTLFFCVRGFTRDGHEFAPEAVRAGAAALVAEEPLGLGVPEVIVPSARAAMAPAAARFFGDPTAVLDVVGITGTTGKTSTAFLVRGLLEATGRRCGLLGTVKSVVAGRERTLERTTPEAIDLQADFRAMVDGGDTACAMEVSSHALELGRADAIHWAVAVFTNLGRDHLDFHPDMEAYFQAKRRLFAADSRTRVVNVDDPYGRRLAAEHPDAVTVALERPADWSARDLESGPGGTRFVALTPEGEVGLAVLMPGRFNVVNALEAAAAVRALGVGLADIAAALPTVERVPGRFEPVDAGQDFTVIVDYSHKPDALENVLRAARELAPGRVTCVFGAGGDRDRSKRPVMGEIADRLADRAIVTSDNPRSEDPEAIIDEIAAGMAPGAERVADRREAIFRAVADAEAGDLVLIAGKGHEPYQEVAGGRKLPFDDAEVAREALAAVGAR